MAFTSIKRNDKRWLWGTTSSCNALDNLDSFADEGVVIENLLVRWSSNWYNMQHSTFLIHGR